MGLEVSRLARNNADWHRLLEICAHADTLILDEDGAWDPLVPAAPRRSAPPGWDGVPRARARLPELSQPSGRPLGSQLI
jgi:hypothetical protein